MATNKASECTVGTPELLLEHSAGRLDAERAIRLDRHAGNCAHCQEFLANQRLVWDALDAYQQATPAVSRDFDRQLYARMASEQQDSWWVRAWRRLVSAGEPGNWKPALSMAAACAVLMTGFLVRVDRPVEPKPVASIAFEKHEIETIERALEDFEMLSAMGAPEQPAEPASSGKL